MKDQINLLTWLYTQFTLKWRKSFSLNDLPCLPDMSLVGAYVSLSGQTLTIKSGKKLIEWYNAQSQQIATDWSNGIGVKNR